MLVVVVVMMAVLLAEPILVLKVALVQQWVGVILPVLMGVVEMMVEAVMMPVLPLPLPLKV
jgi:hypothetical protein